MWETNSNNGAASDGTKTETPKLPKNSDLSESLDTVFEVLAHRNRRAIVTYFLEHNTETATISDLAIQCQQNQDSTPATDATERMTIQLHHQHLPHLEDAGVIEYDTRSETVRYRGDRLLESVLECVRPVDH